MPRNVHLRELLGAHLLTFFADIRVNPAGETPRIAELYGAEVTLKAGGRSMPVGYVRPDQPVKFRFYDHVSTQHVLFAMQVDARQINAIEQARDGGDLDFELLIRGEGTDKSLASEQVCAVQDTWTFHVPRSTWIATLRQANVVNILLFDVPVPLGAKAPHARRAIEYLEKAKSKFLEGDYRACVAECRTAVQELGAEAWTENEWSTGVLKKLALSERGLSKDEREVAILAAVRSYAHLAHHGESEGGNPEYTRADATFALGLTAVIAAHVTRV